MQLDTIGAPTRQFLSPLNILGLMHCNCRFSWHPSTCFSVPAKSRFSQSAIRREGVRLRAAANNRSPSLGNLPFFPLHPGVGVPTWRSYLPGCTPLAVRYYGRYVAFSGQVRCWEQPDGRGRGSSSRASGADQSVIACLTLGSLTGRGSLQGCGSPCFPLPVSPPRW